MSPSRLEIPSKLKVASGGFTVIELLTAVAVVAILVATAIPVFASTIRSNRLASSTNDAIAMFQAMRQEAVRRGRRAIVCPTTDLTTCTTGARWNGWLGFIDNNSNGTLDANETLRVEAVRGGLEFRTSTNVSGGSRVVFRPDGFLYTSTGDLLTGRIAVCLPVTTPAENVRVITMSAGGQMNVSRHDRAGACTVPANPPANPF